MKLYLESASDFSIKNEKGEVLGIEDARQRWESGQVEDCNLAFQRLVDHRFDLQSLRDFYGRVAQQEAKTGGRR